MLICDIPRTPEAIAPSMEEIAPSPCIVPFTIRSVASVTSPAPEAMPFAMPSETNPPMS